jgi:Zinc finger, C4 type (two domains)
MSVVERPSSDDRSGVHDQSVDNLSASIPGSSSTCGSHLQHSCVISRLAASSCATDQRRTVQISSCPVVDATFVSLATDLLPCVVCGDTATGYHYCVYTCEKCKVSWYAAAARIPLVVY